jgi:mRNA-capping enzyme
VRVSYSFLYDWEWEAFAVRPKEFWPLDKARSVLDKMIPQLCHESDGLILQVCRRVPRSAPQCIVYVY